MEVKRKLSKIFQLSGFDKFTVVVAELHHNHEVWVICGGRWEVGGGNSTLWLNVWLLTVTIFREIREIFLILSKHCD